VFMPTTGPESVQGSDRRNWPDDRASICREIRIRPIADVRARFRGHDRAGQSARPGPGRKGIARPWPPRPPSRTTRQRRRSSSTKRRDRGEISGHRHMAASATAGCPCRSPTTWLGISTAVRQISTVGPCCRHRRHGFWYDVAVAPPPMMKTCAPARSGRGLRAGVGVPVPGPKPWALALALGPGPGQLRKKSPKQRRRRLHSLDRGTCAGGAMFRPRPYGRPEITKCSTRSAKLKGEELLIFMGNPPAGGSRRKTDGRHALRRRVFAEDKNQPTRRGKHKVAAMASPSMCGKAPDRRADCFLATAEVFKILHVWLILYLSFRGLLFPSSRRLYGRYPSGSITKGIIIVNLFKTETRKKTRQRAEWSRCCDPDPGVGLGP